MDQDDEGERLFLQSGQAGQVGDVIDVAVEGSRLIERMLLQVSQSCFECLDGSRMSQILQLEVLESDRLQDMRCFSLVGFHSDGD